MSTSRDLIFLARLLRELEKDHSPAELISEISPWILGDGISNPPFRVNPAEKWAASTLVQAAHFIRGIVSRYVQIFQDPRNLPVTHSLRQKNVAIKLDQQFRILLREMVIRSGQVLDENGAAVKDDFLDEPILYLKQEARSKRFPKTKNRGVKLSDLEARFDDKLQVKGAKLSALQEKDSFHY